MISIKNIKNVEKQKTSITCTPDAVKNFLMLPVMDVGYDHNPHVTTFRNALKELKERIGGEDIKLNKITVRDYITMIYDDCLFAGPYHACGDTAFEVLGYWNMMTLFYLVPQFPTKNLKPENVKRSAWIMDDSMTSFVSACFSNTDTSSDTVQTISAFQKEMVHNFENHDFVTARSKKQMADRTYCMKKFQSEPDLTVYHFLHTQLFLNFTEHWEPECESFAQFVERHTALYMWIYYGFYEPLFAAALTLF